MVRSFFFPYIGHKFLETKKFIKICNFNNVDTIVEPFCGACGFSFYLYKNGIVGRDTKFVLNDCDKFLFTFLRDVKDGKLGEYIDYFNEKVILYRHDHDAWNTFVRNKHEHSPLDRFVYMNASRNGSLFCGFDKDDEKLIIDRSSYSLIETFIMSDNVSLLNDDFLNVLETYKNNRNAFVYLDPPYLDSFNSAYVGFTKKDLDRDRVIRDNTSLYIDILFFFKKCNCKTLLSINKNAINVYLFRKFDSLTYDVSYSITKKKTQHLAIVNY